MADAELMINLKSSTGEMFQVNYETAAKCSKVIKLMGPSLHNCNLYGENYIDLPNVSPRTVRWIIGWMEYRRSRLAEIGVIKTGKKSKARDPRKTLKKMVFNEWCRLFLPDVLKTNRKALIRAAHLLDIPALKNISKKPLPEPTSTSTLYRVHFYCACQ